MKEIKFTGYLRPYGVRATSLRDMHAAYDQTREEMKLSGLSDEDSLECEVIVRLRDKRQEWIDLWYQRAMRAVDHPGPVMLKHCKDVTIMIDERPLPIITTAAPRHGDKYDRKVGIAVCYAKMRGEIIPDFI